MTTKALTPTKRAEALPTVYLEQAQRYAKRSRAANTQRAYRAAWAEFSAWAAERGAEALPAQADTVLAYLTALAEAGAKVATIEVKRAAIGAAHRTAKQPDPTTAEDVRLLMGGIRRELGTRPSKKAPVTLADLRALVGALPTDTLSGLRDRALILLGWAGAFRRSELVALDVADVRINGEIKVTIKRSKTDQEGAGQVKVIPALEDDPDLDPVRAMRAHLDAADIHSGAIFRRVDRWGNLRAERLTGQAVALIVKAAALRAGLDPRQFAGHSLRSGFITAAAVAGAESRDIMAQTGHKSEAVMRGYIQDAGQGAKRATLAAFGQKDKPGE